MSDTMVIAERPSPRTRGRYDSDGYKSAEAIFIEESLRLSIRRRVIDIGTAEARGLIRRNLPSMALTTFSSIYSPGAGPAVSIKRLLAAAGAIGLDPLAELSIAIQKRQQSRSREAA